MELGVQASMGTDWRLSIEKVRIAETLGYKMVATGESWGMSSLPWMTLLATHTKKIHIGTGILNVFSRSPAAIAQEFAALEMLSGGRMVCGLGSSGHRVIEHFHGVPFQKPLRRLREYTEIIKMLLARQPLNYEGDLYELKRGFRLDYDQQRDNVPVFIAAITPKSIKQTAMIADGIYPILWPAFAFGSLKAMMTDYAQRAGRTDSNLTIAPITNVYLGNIDEDEDLLNSARQPLFQFINRNGDFYWKMLEKHGFVDEIAASRKAWESRDTEGAMRAISKAMVQSIQVVGSPESIGAQLRTRADNGADLQLIPMPTGTLPEIERKLALMLGS